MKRAVLIVMTIGLVATFIASFAVSQPPGGPRRFELGLLFPPPLIEELNLTSDQELKLDAVKQDLKPKLEKLMTAEQKKTIQNFRPRPPGGPAGGPPGGSGARRRFELGDVLPPPLIDDLKLSRTQVAELDAIKKDVKAKLDTLLTDEQKTLVENFRPRGPDGRGGPGPGGPGGPNDRGGPRGSPIELGPDPSLGARVGPRLITHGALKVAGDAKFPFATVGDAIEGILGDTRLELNGGGVRLLSGEDLNKDGQLAGEVSCRLTHVNNEKGRWYRIRVNALAQPDFAVEKDELFIKVDFFKDDGRNSLDFIKKSVYRQVELERKSLADRGTNQNLGAATWRNYSIDFRTPFREVDTLNVSVGFTNGAGKATGSEFWVAEVEVTPIPDPADYIAPDKAVAKQNPPALQRLVKLGGRWYFDPQQGDATPKQFDHTNVDRLYYLSDRLETPFVGNMSAWLRRGYLDRDGKTIEKDRFVTDAVVVSFTDKYLVVKSKNLPNHPVAVFPDRTRFLDGNPNVIREQNDTWQIPLEPRPNAKRPAAMTMENKRGLPMGPIGIAMNGVVFFNPFDHIAEADAVSRLDRCCGHPSPNSQYHYHKYPVCVNTPWADDGTSHSPLIGFAFDGFPVYGPYESAGVLAKDSERSLNEFNLHEDDQRGPHYHVTPGKFPHIIGGYWGEVESRNRGGRRGPPD